MRKKYLHVLLLGFALAGCTNKTGEETLEVAVKITAFDTAEAVSPKEVPAITFTVSDVVPAASPLRVDSLRKLAVSKVGNKVLFLPEEQKNTLYVPCGNNALIQTVHECYANHRPLVLSPDVIWLAICQGISIHVNEKYDSLEPMLFKKNKPKKLIVRNDSLGLGARHWKKFVADLSGMTRQYTKGDFYSYVVAGHSTTTSIERTAFQVTLLETYKKGFTYVGESGCGIPSVTLRGTKKDWIQIKERLKGLDSLGLGDWGKGMEPVLDEFINVYDQKINIAFWEDIYKDIKEYGAFYTSGWIIKFFPYIKKLEFTDITSEDGATRADEKYVRNEYVSGSRYLESHLSTDDFPSGISKVDVLWNNYLDPAGPVTKELQVCSGFFGMKQNADKSLEPLISWAVFDKKTKGQTGKPVTQKETQTKHRIDYWTPDIFEKPKVKAIYDNKTYATAEAGNTYIENLLQKSILSMPAYKEKGMGPVKIKLVVFSNGAAGDIKVSGTQDEKLKAWIIHTIESLPAKWFPALDQPWQRATIGDPDPPAEADPTTKVKVNSAVHLTLFKE